MIAPSRYSLALRNLPIQYEVTYSQHHTRGNWGIDQRLIAFDLYAPGAAQFSELQFGTRDPFPGDRARTIGYIGRRTYCALARVSDGGLGDWFCDAVYVQLWQISLWQR